MIKMELIERRNQLCDKITEMMVGLSYDEMMECPEIVAIIKERDEKDEKINEIIQTELEDWAQENPEMAEIFSRDF